MEFFPFSYFVKDLTTGAPLAHEWSKNGLYEWPPGDFDGLPQCNVVVPYYMWHQRLGHPNHQVLNKFLHDFSIPVVGSKTYLELDD